MEGLLSLEEDHSLLLSQFREYLDHDDIRYHVMQAATDTVARVANGHPEVSRLGPTSGGGEGACWSPGAQARPLAGAPHVLEQRFHTAVRREPACPGEPSL